MFGMRPDRGEVDDVKPRGFGLRRQRRPWRPMGAPGVATGPVGRPPGMGMGRSVGGPAGGFGRPSLPDDLVGNAGSVAPGRRPPMLEPPAILGSMSPMDGGGAPPFMPKEGVGGGVTDFAMARGVRPPVPAPGPLPPGGPDGGPEGMGDEFDAAATDIRRRRLPILRAPGAMDDQGY